MNKEVPSIRHLKPPRKQLALHIYVRPQIRQPPHIEHLEFPRTRVPYIGHNNGDHFLLTATFIGKTTENKQENNKQEITPYIKSIDEIQADWEWENKDAIADELKYILSLDCYKQYKQSSGACDCSSGACDCVNPFKSNPIENFFKNLN